MGNTMLSRIPEEFYSLFRSSNRVQYIKCLLAIYKANNESSITSIGLFSSECTTIIKQVLSADGTNAEDLITTASMYFRNLKEWKWLVTTYDESENEDLLIFPDYSQRFVELFIKLDEDSGKEHDTIRAVYMSLYTFYNSEIKDTEYLRMALEQAESLNNLLGNMLDNMRNYFNELSKTKNIEATIGLLEDVLAGEDVMRFSFLSTKDSFYRYKEKSKDLIDRIDEWLEDQIQESMDRGGSISSRSIRSRENAMERVELLEKELEQLDYRYRNLSAQHKVFAERALHKLQFAYSGINNSARLSDFIRAAAKEPSLITMLSGRIRVDAPIRVCSEKGLFHFRKASRPDYAPIEELQESIDPADYVTKPRYSEQEIKEFRDRFTVDGVFHYDPAGYTNISDVEKLIYVWSREAKKETVTMGDTVDLPDGVRYSDFTLGGKDV